MANDDPVVHSGDVDWEEGGRGELFGHRRKRLGALAGSRALGCSMIELLPGKTAWPFHHHWGNEEAMFVLEGEATLRLGDRRFVVRAGDYVAFEPTESAAHQMTNTSSAPCRYLMVSTMRAPDVTVYPDSGKIGVFGTLPPGGRGEDALRLYLPTQAAVDYWDGEPGAEGGAMPSAGASTPEPKGPPPSQDARRSSSTQARPGAGDYAARIGRRLDEAFAGLRARLEGAAGQVERGADEAELERQIDAEMEQLKGQLGLQRKGARASSSSAAPEPTRSDEDTRVEDELEALKRKLDE